MKFLVLDGNSILNRAFYGIKLLTTKDGLYTNGIYGFLNILSKLLDESKPDATAVAFDLPAPTFRHLAYDGYKATRKGMPEELRPQVPILKELLDLMGIPRLEAEGFEADDILGTEAAACAARGDDCILATGDRDSLQLVDATVNVWLAATRGGRPETTVYDPEKIRETYGVTPRQLIEVKALMGDTSDNIPGVAGVGEKTALDLVRRFGSVEEIYARLPELDIRDSLRKKLEAGRESAKMSRNLAEIRTDAPVPTDPAALVPRERDGEKLRAKLAQLEFYSLIEKMGLSDLPQTQAQEGSAGDAAVSVASDGGALAAAAAGSSAADFCAVFDGEELAAVAFAAQEGLTAALPGRTEGLEKAMRAILSDEQIVKRTYNIKPLFAWCNRKGVPFAGACFDTMLAGYLLNPLASSYEPERLCAELGLAPPAPAGGGDLPEPALACARDAAAVRALAVPLAEQLEKNGQHRLNYEVELPLARVLADMEVRGFRVDAEGIAAYGAKLEARLSQMQAGIYEQVGYEFNINSTKQLGEALFVKLGLPARKKTRTGYSTNAEVLESLRGYHPVIELLLGYRKLSKLKSTYTDGLLKVIGPDGRIHSSFNQVETRTGRISSTEPNLQNIPVRSGEGREMRRFFIPAPGCVLIDADYSQIELRILAHVADDAAMQQAFNRHDDIHTITASQVFRMPPEMITPLLRSRAKAVNFGIVYGIGAYSLSQDIGVSVKEADSYIRSYLETFSGVRNYMEQVVKKAREQGYVETLLGRRRMLPELSSSNRNIRNFGERVALNTPIQGTAADIIKIAMIRVDDRLRREGLKARLILQVHDELIVESPEPETERAAKIVQEEMENAMPLKVKLEVEVHTGNSWYSAKG